MNSLLVVIPVHAPDVEAVTANLRACIALEGKTPHHAIVVHDVNVPQTAAVSVRVLAEHCFEKVERLCFSPSAGGAWPVPQNRLWQNVARELEGQWTKATSNPFGGARGWLWWESDVLPLRPKWISLLADAYHKAKKPFFGHVSGERNLSATAIYPFNISSHCEKAMLAKQSPFENVLSQELKKETVFKANDYIARSPVLYNKTGSGPSGHGSTNIENIIKQHPQALLYQGIRIGLEVTGDTQSHRSTVAPLYTISVLCHNNLALTKQCIASILKHSADYELIITDNASTDGTLEHLHDIARKHPKLRIFSNEKNLGFQEPNEAVLENARGRYLVLFNNDMVACAGWLDALRAPFEKNVNLAVTGLAGTCCAIDAKLTGVPGDDRKPEYIEAGCLMAPVALMRKHGLFSPYLQFAYWEDTDLGLRMRELGYDLATVKLPISHQHRGATTKLVNLTEVRKRNHAAMWERWSFYVKRRNFKRRVRVIRRGARGDVLLTTPALMALRRKWPQAEIHVLTAHPEMLTGLPGIQCESTPEGEMDHIYDLDFAYEKRPFVPIVQVFADVCGVKLTSNRPMMVATEQDMAWARTVARNEEVALIHAGPTTWLGKNWPVERFEEVTAYLHTQGFFTIAVGAADSPSVGCSDSVAGCTTPQQLYALCKEAKIFVGLDSMPQHIASAADTPSVILFGATDPDCIARLEPHIWPVQASRQLADCVGEHGRRKGAVTSAPCQGDCMRAITTENVIEGIGMVL